MTTTTAGALDPEDIGQEITIHLPSGQLAGRLDSITHSPDCMVRLKIGRRHIIVNHNRKITLSPA